MSQTELNALFAIFFLQESQTHNVQTAVVLAVADVIIAEHVHELQLVGLSELGGAGV